MNEPHQPPVEPRRRAELLEELRARARAWLPGWDLDPALSDFGGALFEIAARFSADVAERLDRSGEKTTRGLVDWLGIGGAAPRAARVPVVFKLADKTPRPVFAPAPVRLRADAGGAAVMFETESELTLAPARLAALVAADPDADAFYLPPPGIASVQSGPALPDRWRTRSFAAGGSAVLQLDPALGLEADMLVEVADPAAAGKQQYRVVGVDKDIVTLDRPLEAPDGLAPGSAVTRVRLFAPFAPGARNRQLHALYIGDAELFNLDSAAIISLEGLDGLPGGTKWEYYGKGAKAGVDWQDLPPAPTDYPGLALSKPAGALEALKVGAVEGKRWIRARVDRPQELLSIEQIRVALNPPLKDKCPFGQPVRKGGVEVVANTAPQVLGEQVYPFGRDPRQFDAFYIGCAEAFSKPGAQVALTFDLAAPSMRTLALVPLANVDAQVIAGVGQDGYLHLFTVDGGKAALLHAPVQPQALDAGGAGRGAKPIVLDGREGQPARPAAWIGSNREFFVAVAAAANVWVWHEFLASDDPSRKSEWIDYGAVAGGGPAVPIVDLVQAGGSLYALRGGLLYRRELGGTAGWQKLEPTFGPALQAEAPLVALAPVLEAGTGHIDPATVPALCAVAAGGAAYFGWLGNDPQVLHFDLLEDLPAVDHALRPLCLAMAANGNQRGFLAIALESAGGGRLVSFLSAPGAQPGLRQGIQGTTSHGPALGAAQIVGRDFGVAMLDGQAAVFVALNDRLVEWTPLSGSPPLAVLAWPTDFGQARGAPLVVGGRRIIVPGPRGDLLTGDIVDEDDRATLDADKFRDAVVATVALAVDDTVALDLSPDPSDYARLDSAGAQHDGKYVSALPAAKSGLASTVRLYKTSAAGSTAPRVADKKDTLQAGDKELKRGVVVLVRYDTDRRENRVAKVTGAAATRLVVFEKELPEGEVEYWLPAGDAVLQPVVILDRALADRWKQELAGKQPIHFDGLDPAEQTASMIAQDASGVTLLLPAPWKRQPVTGVHAWVRNARLEWTRQLGDTSNNPELSWEYSNGTGWWKLPGVEDRTANFQRSDSVTFSVPDDLAESEWVGKKDYWIRARLVGGDYGHEVVSATSRLDKDTGATIQQVTRDTSAIRAPVVLKLTVSYNISARLPESVLSEDGAAFRDQSEANKVSGAAVEAFVPLAEMLRRLDGTPAPGRALYLGFEGTLQGDALKLLVLAAAGSGAVAPVRVEVLRGTRFEPVGAADDTRGLSETGLLSMALPAAAEPAPLFGRTLGWLRVRPSAAGAGQAWMPALRGIYLNAVWARAAETQAEEMLGSSDGAPLQQVQLARPPVLERTLELRVREPLGDQEREGLLAAGVDVQSRDGALGGDWVLWKQVSDPSDSGRGDRVYAFDESSGVIRFGDGLHGAIPPIGRDAIMAFAYQRTDLAGDMAPANAIAAGSTLAMVTSIEGVEGALAADDAAGGMPAETPARILRAAPSRLRQRGCALTAHDLEDLALALFREVAQARTMASGTATRLVLVARAADPRPAPALLREARRELLEKAPPALAVPGAFEVSGPRLRPFQVTLKLAAASFDHAARLADQARKALRAWFDSTAGGRDGQGWPLGERPDEVGIAACLLGLEYLDGVLGVQVTELAADGAVRPLGTLRPDELALLADDGIALDITLPREAP